MDLVQIQKLAKADRYDEALAACETLLLDGKLDRADVLRARAYVFARSGDHARASADREEILRMENSTIRDHYQAAEQALKAGNLDLAARRFLEVKNLGEEQQEAWFESATFFYLAYVELQRRNFDAALAYAIAAKSSDPECAMPLPGVGMVSIRDLEHEIQRRKR